jgi:hypothetical protein
VSARTNSTLGFFDFCSRHLVHYVQTDVCHAPQSATNVDLTKKSPQPVSRPKFVIEDVGILPFIPEI